MNKHKVFLGGTCNGSTWRDELIPLLEIDYFNPVVDDWTPECQDIEIEEKEKNCFIHLYVITKEMVGVFSIAEAVDSANNYNKATIFHVITDGFDEKQIKNLKATANLIESRDGIINFNGSLKQTAKIINELD